MMDKASVKIEAVPVLDRFLYPFNWAPVRVLSKSELAKLHGGKK